MLHMSFKMTLPILVLYPSLREHSNWHSSLASAKSFCEEEEEETQIRVRRWKNDK